MIIYTYISIYFFLYVTLDHKTSLNSTIILVAIAKNTLFGSKIIDFSIMPKVIRMLSKDHVPWRYFVNFQLYCKYIKTIICIAKNFIWTALKAISFCILRFQIFKKLSLGQIMSYPKKPYINGKQIYSAFGWCINLYFKKFTLMWMRSRVIYRYI